MASADPMGGGGAAGTEPIADPPRDALGRGQWIVVGEPVPVRVRLASSRRRRRLGWLVVVVAVTLATVGSFAATLRFAGVDRGALARFRPPPLVTPHPSLGAMPLDAVAAAALPSVVTVEVETPTGEEFGTGWLFDDLGDFVTNYHVVATRNSVRLLDRSATVHPAVVVGYSIPADVAVVRATDGVRGRPLPVFVGDPPVPQQVVVLASGKATGEGDRILETLDRLHQPVPVQADVGSAPGAIGQAVYGDMMVLRDHRIFRGNSGGPVLDAFGRVLGIVTLASQSAPQAYAIPIGRVVDDLRALARGQRAG